MSIVVTHPEKAEFWDYSKNSSSPRAHTFGQADLANWICPVDPSHVWKQRICDFLRRQTDCPYCARKTIPTSRSLLNKFPGIASEWHSKKNGVLTPDKVLAFSPSLAWWQCQKHKRHVFCAPIKSRTSGKLKCPYCTAKEIPANKNFALTFPDTAAFWNNEKNYDLTAHDVAFDSPIVVYFHCAKTIKRAIPHRFRTSIEQASREGLNCPSCQTENVNQPDLATAYPEIAAIWHKTKNKKLKPGDITAKSSRLVWWKCSEAEDHEWRSSVVDRVEPKNKCPFCSGRKVSSTKSFASSYPDLLSQWHWKKNSKVNPNEIPASYLPSVYWQCEKIKTHVWQASVSRRVHLKTGCPKCANWSPKYSGKRTGEYSVPKEKSLAFQYPEVAERWHPTKNGDITPKDVAAHSKRKAFFQCKLFPDHAWEARISHLAVNCPRCVSFTCPREESLKAIFPDIARQWHPTKNLPIKSTMVRPKSNKPFFWICTNDKEHVWSAPVYRRTGLGSGCPICAKKIVTKDCSLTALHPEISRQWHPTKNGALKPSSVAPGSGQRVWWRCKKGPDHEWQAAIHNRVSHSSGCPCCAGRKFSVTTTIAYTHPAIAMQWYQPKNAQVRPDQVKFSDPRTFYFVCNRRSDHIFKSTLQSRIKAKHDCPICFRNGILPGQSLQDLYPEIAAELHSSRNGKLTSKDVAAHSGKLVYWRCSVNARHIWKAQVCTRTGNGTGCPKCWERNRRLRDTVRHTAADA